MIKNKKQDVALIFLKYNTKTTNSPKKKKCNVILKYVIASCRKKCINKHTIISFQIYIIDM